jgi:hypothetical protein
MNNNKTTRRSIPFFFTVQNGAVLDNKLGILAKVQFSPSNF